MDKKTDKKLGKGGVDLSALFKDESTPLEDFKDIVDQDDAHTETYVSQVTNSRFSVSTFLVTAVSACACVRKVACLHACCLLVATCEIFPISKISSTFKNAKAKICFRAFWASMIFAPVHSPYPLPPHQTWFAVDFNTFSNPPPHLDILSSLKLLYLNLSPSTLPKAKLELN